MTGLQSQNPKTLQTLPGENSPYEKGELQVRFSSAFWRKSEVYHSVRGLEQLVRQRACFVGGELGDRKMLGFLTSRRIDIGFGTSKEIVTQLGSTFSSSM
jgi:hypothetical protein